MKKLIITLTMVTGMLLTSYAQASSFTSQTFGNTTYHSGGGLNGSSQTFGNTTYHNGTYNGRSYSGTSQTFGNNTYHSFWD